MNNYVQKLKYENKISILTTNMHKTKHKNQTKTMLSPQGPQWSRHSVARVRRRGDRPPPIIIRCGNVYLFRQI
jgi:hypothetical protein